MILNEIHAVFGYGKETYTSVQWQYNYGQILVIENLDLPDTFEAHFSKDYGGGNSKTVIGTDNRVQVPYEYFEEMGNIYCFLFLHEGEDDGATKYCITIPLKSRPKPSDDPPTEHEQTVIEQAIFALNTAVIEADGYADDAEQSATEAQEYAEQAKESAESIDTSNLATKSELRTVNDGLRNDMDGLRNGMQEDMRTLKSEVVKHTAQTLTDAQKAQARTNIGAITASEAPVRSVNGKTGAVNLLASDVGALPSSTVIPSKTSDLVNDSGFLTQAPVQSVNGMTGAVTLPTATTSADGLMSSTDKTRLDALYADYSSALTALGV